jgi:GDP-4-dehydro-6-deoxy-D-mannose reductase
VSIESIARRLLALAGLDVPIVADPDRMRAVDVPELRGDPGCLRAATGWEPTIELDRTLTDVLASFG